MKKQVLCWRRPTTRPAKINRKEYPRSRRQRSRLVKGGLSRPAHHAHGRFGRACCRNGRGQKLVCTMFERWCLPDNTPENLLLVSVRRDRREFGSFSFLRTIGAEVICVLSSSAADPAVEDIEYQNSPIAFETTMQSRSSPIPSLTTLDRSRERHRHPPPTPPLDDGKKPQTMGEVRAGDSAFASSANIENLGRKSSASETDRAL